MWRKVSEAVGSATPDPGANELSAQPVPPSTIANKPAPGRTGPRGLSPRTTYTRVHSVAPPQPDAGSSGQKSQHPRGMEFLPPKVAHQENIMPTTAMKRPQLHELIKEAVAGTVSKVDIDAEAERQLANMGMAPPPKEKTAAAPQMELTPTNYIDKLAGALEYGAALLKKADVAETQIQPGKGPNALEIWEAPSGENPVQPGNQGQATSKNVPPMTPPMASSGVAKDPSNAMQDNDSMMHGEQPTEPISNETAPLKTAAARALYLRNQAAIGLRKTASRRELYAKNLASLGLMKQAEDAIDPASISAGGAEATGAEPPPAASPSEEQVPTEPSDVSRQKALIASNQAAIDYKKVQAKADPKSDMGDVVTEPAQSSSTDKTLDMVFAKTREAGAKIAADLTRTAAAQAVLAKHAAEAAQRAAKKEKQSQGMANPQLATPQGQSGFRSDSTGM